MKRRGYWLAMMFVAVALMGVVGCGQEAPTGKAGAPSKPATEPTGQAIVDSVNAPLDKARQVEGALGKAADKTADTIKDATQ